MHLFTKAVTFISYLVILPSFRTAKVLVDGFALTTTNRAWGDTDDHASGHMNSSLFLPSQSDEFDVIIVGGGLSGLMAAYDLQKAGLKTILLEARHTLGGKSRSQKLRSSPGIIELGATWINNYTQPEVFALAQKFGLETIVQYNEGDTIFQDVYGNVQRSSPGESSNVTHTSPDDIATLEAKMMIFIEQAAAKVDIYNWDDFPIDQDVSFADWVAQYGFWSHPHLQGLCRGISTALVGREPEEVGAHYLLDYIKSGGGLGALMGQDTSGAQFLWIKQGTTSIANNLARSLGPGSVQLDSPVDKISQNKDTSIITIQSGRLFKAKKVILAITPNVYRNIEFSPPLPWEKERLISQSKPGIYAKVVLAYSKSWWREAGLAGQFTSLVGPICFSWEISDPSQSLYTLALFVTGDIATRWHDLSEYQREQSIINHLVDLVGKNLIKEARNVLEVNQVDWTKESYIRGGPTSSHGPRMLREYGTSLRKPFKNLHFAGTETAYEWKGYMEGAITAGQRAANEVIGVLKRER